MSAAENTSEYVVEQLLPDVRKGRMVILVDDEKRENEGDLFVAAERATPDAITLPLGRIAPDMPTSLKPPPSADQPF